MLSLFLLSVILIIFISNNQIVLNGASYGLMLWYQNVLPLLLPFMLISSIMEEKIKFQSPKNPTKAIAITLFLGFLCGYPIGAKTTASFVKDNIYDKHLGNIFLPICNNISPMFLSGYIVHVILQDKLSFCCVIFLIYIPYIIYALIMLIIYKEKSATDILEINYKTNYFSQINHLENAITQITFVGFYIMLCSIGIELITNIPQLPETHKSLLSGFLEITRGTNYIFTTEAFNTKTKTALIISLTSWGGISSILQTAKVIKQSELSLLRYILIKIICSTASFGLCLLFI